MIFDGVAGHSPITAALPEWTSTPLQTFRERAHDERKVMDQIRASARGVAGLTLTFYLRYGYHHLECLLKKSKSVSSCSRARWIS